MYRAKARRARSSLLLMIGVLVSCGATGYSPAAPAGGADLEGKWRVRFSGSVNIQLPIEFSAVASGAAEAIVLTDVGIHFHEAQWRNGELRMKASTPQGDMKINARMEAGILVGEWAADHAVGQFLVKGTLNGVRLPDNALGPIRGIAVFDSVWSMVNGSYYDPHFHAVDWLAVRDELRPLAASASSDGAAFKVISTMLGRLPSSHLSFAPVLPASPSPAVAPVRVVTWRTLSATTGYIRIAHFAASGRDLEVAAAQVDSAFAELGHLPGILVDLRDNPGGNGGMAAVLAGHLVQHPVPVGVFASRAGLARYFVSSIDELDFESLPVLDLQPGIAHRQQEAMAALGGAVLVRAGGTRGSTYAGAVGVLVNRATYSTAEAVAGALGESGRATVLGTRSAGQMVAGRTEQVAPGWQLMWPEYDYRTARGTKLEGQGVRPDVELTGSGEETLERARAWLEAVRR